MTWMEMRSDPYLVHSLVEDELGKRYGSEVHGNVRIFEYDESHHFSLHVLGKYPPWDYIVVDYQESGEDGDGFYPVDYESLEDMLSAMIEEIEQAN